MQRAQLTLLHSKLCSDTAPTQGTLKVFPDVYLSNAYLILRPFFKLKENLVTKDQLDPENWELGKP